MTEPVQALERRISELRAGVRDTVMAGDAQRARGLAPRVAAVLEGGYNTETLPGLVEATLEGFG